MPTKIPPRPTYADLAEELHTLRVDRANHLADVCRVFAWLDTSNRQSAVTAFSDGPERQQAYQFEAAMRGEHICTKCGLRQQNGEAPNVDF